MKDASFAKVEHLCGEKRISHLFNNGKAFICYPFRVVYVFDQKQSVQPIQWMVSVPKKRFKRAVKRNRLKRLMRESIRLNKFDLIDLLQDNKLAMHVSCGYVSNDMVDFNMAETKMKLVMKKLHDVVLKKVEAGSNSKDTNSKE